MNKFDTIIINYINKFSNQSWIFDEIIGSFNNSLLKGGVLITVVWWLWFKNDEHQSNNRKNIISTLISCIIAIVLARGLALLLPFRYRPLHDERLDFLPPYGLDITMLDGWSSFPSDHAVLFFSLCWYFIYIKEDGDFCTFIYDIVYFIYTNVFRFSLSN